MEKNVNKSKGGFFMKERRIIFKGMGYLLMIITLTVVAFLTPRFLEKEVNAAVDTTAPTLPTVEISSNNTNNIEFAKLADTITLSIIANEDIQTPIVTIAGQSATVTGSGDTYSATYIVVEETVEEVAGINITYADIAGNSGTVETETTDSSTVTIDKTAPTLLEVKVSNYLELAKVGDRVRYTITASESIKIPTTTHAEETGTVLVLWESNYTKFFSYYTVVATTPEGEVAINVTYEDLAGNTGIPVTTTTNSSTVTVDKTVPTLEAVTIESDAPYTVYQGDTVILSITASEDIQRPVVTIAGQSATVTGSGNTYTATYTVLRGTPRGEAEIYVRFIDMAGNLGVPITETTNNSTVTIHTNEVSSQVWISSDSSESFAKVGDTITLTMTSVSDLEPPMVTIAGQTAAVQRDIGFYYLATHIVTAETPEGVVEFEVLYQYRDDVKTIPITTTTDSSTVTVDSTIPTLEAVTIESDNHNTSFAKVGDTVTVAITANKDLQTPTVTIAGQTAIVTGSGNKYTATYTVVAGTPEGEAGINITYADEAGNAGTVVTTTNSSTVTIDKTTPTLEVVTIESDNDNPTSAKIGDTITLRLTTSELLLTIPTVTPTVRIAGQAVTVTGSGNEYMVTYIVTAETPEGLAEINITFADLAGHAGILVTATTNSSTVTVDKTAPELDSVAGGAVNTVDVATWIAPEATANDDIDGDISDDVVVTYYKADGTTLLADLTAARTELTEIRDIVVKYNVSDAAGNATPEVSATFRIATTPIITRGNWTLAQEYIFTANESIVEYSLDGGTFIAIDSPIGGEYTVSIGDNLPHQLVLKDIEDDLSDSLPIEAKATGNDNLMFYASKGLLPWDSDANWEYTGTGSITSDILDGDGNCQNEYGEGAACYKIYYLDVDGEQVKVLQQLDDSSTVILQTIRQLDVDDYNNLYSNGGSVRGRVILPYGNTYAGIGDPNTGNYAGNSQVVEYGAFVGLQFEPEMIPGGGTKRRYGLNITYEGGNVKIITPDGSIVLNGATDVTTIGGSQTVNLPIVKLGDPLDFEIRIPKTAGAIGLLPKAEIYTNGIYIGEMNFGTFGGGSTGNKVSIGSGSTGGTNRAIIIENFGTQINNGDIDVLAPISGGANVVDNPIYIFESNEEVSGYQVNDENWITVEPTFQIADILLSDGQNDLRVRDISGNIVTYSINVDTTPPSE